jgi:hypothetical protein
VGSLRRRRTNSRRPPPRAPAAWPGGGAQPRHTRAALWHHRPHCVVSSPQAGRAHARAGRGRAGGPRPHRRLLGNCRSCRLSRYTAGPRRPPDALFLTQPVASMPSPASGSQRGSTIERRRASRTASAFQRAQRHPCCSLEGVASPADLCQRPAVLALEIRQGGRSALDRRDVLVQGGNRAFQRRPHDASFHQDTSTHETSMAIQ